MIVANVSHTLINCIDLVSLYFRLLWYHSILKGSIDQYSKIHSPLACSRWLPWFPDLSRPYVACVKRGSGETYVRSQSLSSESAVKSIPTSGPRRAKRDSNILSPGEQDWSNALPQGQQRQSNPHPMPCLPLRRLYIDRCIRSSIDLGTWRRFETGQSHDPL